MQAIEVLEPVEVGLDRQALVLAVRAVVVDVARRLQPIGHRLRRVTSDQIAQKANKWGSRNNLRWSNAEYEALFKAAQTELDPVKLSYAALFFGVVHFPIKGQHTISPVLPLYRAGLKTSAGRTALCPSAAVTAQSMLAMLPRLIAPPSSTGASSWR